ncbi:MAG: arylamine N-acetyltransferase [Thermomicrobiales bacterium]
MLNIPAYLARIHYDGPVESTLPVLRDLHLAHLRAVPFENLDIHLNRPISLDEEALFDKIVRRRRGGFCYELNGLFAALLREIGYTVTLLAAQFPLPPERVTTEFDHLVLRVDAPGMPPVLADIAAGRRSFALPLRIWGEAPQTQPEAGATFRLLPEGDGVRLWRRETGGEWERVYRFTWQPRSTADFLPGCHFHQTSPESDFTRKQVCTLMTDRGRITLSDDRLITTVDGARTEETLPDAAAIRAALRDHFSIDLDA